MSSILFLICLVVYGVGIYFALHRLYQRERCDKARFVAPAKEQFCVNCKKALDDSTEEQPIDDWKRVVAKRMMGWPPTPAQVEQLLKEANELKELRYAMNRLWVESFNSTDTMLRDDFKKFVETKTIFKIKSQFDCEICGYQHSGITCEMVIVAHKL